ncbi:transcriptional regulator [Dinoroseobacter shibae DFL 12 = DSM 16493]|jgi:DNA-binding LacI/PurR family transcriptional regulator|uniref:Transcriptional regulator n=1 Tax=Dinoroseobacter shibae (strain DSM 16493 / NCIMB 14021 / DFL 12) TaxID=398580 RepID=A8LLW4_DINSH|nr:LacI family DNA-binding transcriptional regulator [Dinoroseobacter shibae]ABV94873.1 transcriptional regulator [Dinoroseobacter shibae DFL 12 = DSM 16493]URF46294.1 LacI family transcriptional regulator [Dinoroseobacter shibae]URF50600.1 LacI family transcriptional regulator [Dinoroseobacter shibae]
MGSTRVTARDVARAAGVSQPTVSRVFSRSAAVDPAKADRVRAAARELGYIPNLVARSLNSGHSFRIGIVLAYLKNGFFSDALQRLSKALNARGYSVTVYFAGNQSDEVDAIVDDLLADRVDGIILASISLSNSLVARVRKSGIPCVLFNRGQADPDVSMVTAANVAGARAATEFLIAGGHTRIAHLAGWRKSMNGRDRQAGFLAAMAAAGLAPVACVDCHFRRSVAMDETRKLFAEGPGADAIFAANDHMAFGVLEVLRAELGLRVPEDVSVIGYDDAPMAGWKTFDLTTVRQPLERMTRKTVDLLIARITEPDAPPEKIEIPGDLIVRGSARHPPGWTPPPEHTPQPRT